MLNHYLLHLVSFLLIRLSPKSYLLFCLLALLIIPSTHAQTIRYVTTTGTNTDPTSATSWAASTTSFQGAINSLSATGGEVWVAAGVYKPTTTADRTISFSLRNKVTIYGGFPASGNPSLADRVPASFTTTLSGNIGYLDTADDNSYHVISNPSSLSLTSTAVLDGFVITGGNANGKGDGSSFYGAGMYNTADLGNTCSPTVRNCDFVDNKANYGGAGIINLANGGVSSPIITNCSFSTNTAPYGSGGVQNNATNNGTCSPVLTNCRFRNNDGHGVDNFGSNTSGGICNPVLTNCNFDGNYGGMFNMYSDPQLINCRFTGNFSGARIGLGGAIYNDSGNPVLINCTFTKNGALNNGGALYNANGAPSLVNCVFDGNNSFLNGGGAIYHLWNRKMQLVNCSLINNSGDSGGGIYAESNSPVQLTNCILWNNGGNKTFAGGTPPIVTYSLLEPNVYAYTYTDGGNNQVTATSPFSSTANLALSAGTLAINAGSNAAYTAVSGPATDLINNPRIQYGLIDLGANESAFSHDLTPTLYARPSTVNGTGAVSVVIDAEEINSVATHGLLTVKITKDPAITLTFPASATTIDNRPVQNGSWQFSAADPDYYILTTQQSVPAGDKLSFGLLGTLSSGSTTGILTISTTVVSTDAQETKLTNNADADKVEYFQQ